MVIAAIPSTSRTLPLIFGAATCVHGLSLWGFKRTGCGLAPAVHVFLMLPDIRGTNAMNAEFAATRVGFGRETTASLEARLPARATMSLVEAKDSATNTPRTVPPGYSLPMRVLEVESSARPKDPFNPQWQCVAVRGEDTGRGTCLGGYGRSVRAKCVRSDGVPGDMGLNHPGVGSGDRSSGAHQLPLAATSRTGRR